MPGVGAGEEALVLRFLEVVELLDEPRPDLFDHWSCLEPGKGHLHAREQHAGVVEIGPDGLVDAGVLQLHGHGLSLVGDGAVHLADGRGRNRDRVPLGEDSVGGAAEFALDDAGRQVGAHRRRVLLQLGQRVSQRLGQTVVEVAEHLADLHQGALHDAGGRARPAGARMRTPAGPGARRRTCRPWRPGRRRGRCGRHVRCGEQDERRLG